MADDTPKLAAATTLATEVAGAPHAATAFDHAARGVAGDRFELGRELGRGGMGRVVEATDVALDRKVAIKQALSTRPSDVARFEREVRITAQLEHPSIVPVHEAGRDERGQPYYVMRRIDGKPLSDVAAAARDLAARLALIPNVLAAIDAAAYAHARRIIHRDIKPWNILVGAYGETLLIDWGLARRIDAGDGELPGEGPGDEERVELTRAGETYGTPGYMAPEQARGDAVDTRADVYALGATLFHVLAGASPAAGRAPAEWIAEAAEGAIEPPLALLDPAAPRELVTVVTKAMAARADDRYRDAGELAADVRAFLAGQLVGAHRCSTLELARRFVRRHRLAVATVTIAALALATFGAVAVRRIVAERDRANDAAEIAHRERERSTLERDRAEDRSQQLLVERASTLAAIDPTRAVALLRNLPATSRHVQRARDIARNAATHGVAHGATLSGKQLNAIAISPDERRAAAMGEDGIIYLVDFATAEKTILLETGAWISGAVWADGGATLVFVQHGALRAVDVATRAVRTLADNVGMWGPWAGPAADSVRFVAAGRRGLVEVSTRGGEARVLVADVDSAHVEGDVAIVETAGRVRLFVDGGREIPLVERPEARFKSLVVSRDLGRVAANLDDEVFDWDRTGKLVGTWKVREPTRLGYGTDVLFAATLIGAVQMLVPGQEPREVDRSSPASLVWGGRSSKGLLAFLFNSGHITLGDAAGVRSFPFPYAGSRALAVGTRVFAAASGPELRWWNLEHVSPRLLFRERGSWCAADDTHMYALGADALFEIDRATGAARRVVDSEAYDHSMSCKALYRGTIFARTMLGEYLLVDVDTGRVHNLGEPRAVGGGSRRGFVFARETKLVERERAAGREVVRWTAPARIDAISAVGAWAAVQTAAQLYRVNLETGASESSVRRPIASARTTTAACGSCAAATSTAGNLPASSGSRRSRRTSRTCTTPCATGSRSGSPISRGGRSPMATRSAWRRRWERATAGGTPRACSSARTTRARSCTCSTSRPARRCRIRCRACSAAASATTARSTRSRTARSSSSAIRSRPIRASCTPGSTRRRTRASIRPAMR
ncbi:MAG: serine/threonine protein kinase [Deltaproteobacteria bacterium]|nr:serine/threonine protein kinase [Deltaproteobacteria bacterium]